MIRLPAPCKRGAPRCHLARQVNPILGGPNIQVLANLFGGRPWVNGCQGMRPAMPAAKNQAMPAEPKDTKPAEKKSETEKIPEAKKTECREPSKPATTTDADHPTDQTSANANRLPGILADLTPLLGPMQAEQIAQFLRNISAPQQIRSLRRKKQRRSSQSSSFRSNLASLANLEVLSPLSWGLRLWRQPSHFWRPSLRLARTILPRMVRKSLEKEITRQRKSKCQHKRKRPRRRRTLSQKRKRKQRPKTTIKKTQTSK